MWRRETGEQWTVSAVATRVSVRGSVVVGVPAAVGDGGDIVRLVSHLPLPQDELIGRGPGADQVNRTAAEALVVRPSQLLAGNGDHWPAAERAGGPDPVQEASPELIGGEDPAHPPNRVVRWHAVGQIKKRGKPGPFAAAKPGDGDPSIGAAAAGADGDRQDRQQISAGRNS